MSINFAIVSGNLTRDPEMRETAGGMPVMRFGVAVNERVKDKSGEWTDRANYFNCTMFGKRAQAVSRYLAKGMKVCVSGRLRYDEWQKDGQKRTGVEIIVEELEFMQSGNKQTAKSEYVYASESVCDEDIPF